ncbi:MAG: methyltransferase domain-containing protein [Hyphomicrobiales bacterium]|nr:methyltransferase domain-containing protein [Hyphomicrobiales bacterium]
MAGGDAAARDPREASDTDQARMAFILHLRERGIADVNVLRALETVPREKFVPRRYADLAWRDLALPIACGQFMPDPHIVARTMEALALTKSHRVLEIGAGSGYSTAILARLAGRVISFERYRTLALEAQSRLATIGAPNAEVIHGDGLESAAEHGTFDRIVVHLSLPDGPKNLLDLLSADGRIVFGSPAKDGKEGGLFMLGNAADAPDREKLVVPARFPEPIAGRSRAL